MELDNSTIVLILYCILAFVLAFYPAYLIFPRFIRKMKSLGNTGKDFNKRGNIQVAESGGIVAVFSFSLAMFVIQEENITKFATISDWMIPPAIAGGCSSPALRPSPTTMRT